MTATAFIYALAMIALIFSGAVIWWAVSKGLRAWRETHEELRKMTTTPEEWAEGGTRQRDSREVSE